VGLALLLVALAALLLAAPALGSSDRVRPNLKGGLQLMEGELSVEPPMQTLMACVDMPLPDSDNDGFPDQNDYYPFDPTRH
jgi:hypothetical protein